MLSPSWVVNNFLYKLPENKRKKQSYTKKIYTWPVGFSLSYLWCLASVRVVTSNQNYLVWQQVFGRWCQRTVTRCNRQSQTRTLSCSYSQFFL